MYDKIIQILSISEDDTSALDLIQTLIDICSDEAVAFTHEKDTEKLEEVIIAMVVERYNTLDYAGISSTSYSGVSQSFRDGYSEQVKALIRAKRHLKLV
jgi:hypothetical protein